MRKVRSDDASLLLDRTPQRGVISWITKIARPIHQIHILTVMSERTESCELIFCRWQPKEKIGRADKTCDFKNPWPTTTSASH